MSKKKPQNQNEKDLDGSKEQCLKPSSGSMVLQLPTGVGSFHTAPTIDGLKMARGSPLPSWTRTYSARLFVYVYVFGLLPISLGVRVSTSSSSIQLEEKKSCLFALSRCVAVSLSLKSLTLRLPLVC